MRECNTKTKEMNKKRRRGADPTTTPLSSDSVIKSRDMAAQLHEKLKTKNVLSHVETLIESFENNDEVENIEEPGTE